MQRAGRVSQSLISAILSAISVYPASSQVAGVYTSRYNTARTGENTSETILTLQNVNSTQFGKIFSYAVDGQIYGQPLYVAKVSIAGGTHNVVYVATELDSVYAFDADGLVGTPLWHVNFTDPAEGIEAVPCGTDGDTDISCGVYPYYGITGTPVIDPTTNTMYLVSRTYNENTSTGYQDLHALDITTGADKPGSPVPIEGAVPGTGAGSVSGVISFDELQDVQRPGLTLLTNSNGSKTVYIGWAGAEHGWIMAYDATALTQNAIFATTPNAIRGGVWQSGNAFAVDRSGYIYASTGDGDFDVTTGGLNYGDTLLKMDNNLNIIDYFTPMDQACRATHDFDLASSGPMILPTQSGTYPDEVLTSGKGGDPCDSTGAAPIYLANQNDLGEYDPESDQIIQEIEGSPSGYWSSAAYWQGASQANIYYAGTTATGGSGDYLKMYSLISGTLSTSPVSQSSNIFNVGATPTVSSNGTANGIVWAIERQDSLGISPGVLPAILYAYNATNLSTMLYASNQDTARDQGGCANKFQVPTVVNGKVYVATQNELDVFGLVTSGKAAPQLSLSHPCYSYPDQTVGTTSTSRFLTLTNNGNATLKFKGGSIRGLNSGDFKIATNNCSATLAAGASCTVTITFTPSATGPRVAQIFITDNAVGSPQNVQLTGVGEE
jgi:Abnormal spindle-like microcephaly-assoc'd, ASPM-SPD-2-Hydin